ncbi:MAG: hypothetical protein MJ087_05635 [Lachnospiraceae bacterium]|nr:hypothetical protein [Lachnospiraceae bacterium]
MKKKNILSILLAISLCFVMTACSTGPSAEDLMKESVLGFFTNVKTGEFQKALENVKESSSFNDELGKERYNEDTESGKAMIKILNDINDQLTYEIKDVVVDEKDENKGTVTASVKFVDSEDFVKEFFGEVLIQAFSNWGEDVSEEEEDAQLAKILEKVAEKEREVKYIEEDITINMVKDEESWKIADIDDDLANAITGNLMKSFEEVEKALEEE